MENFPCPHCGEEIPENATFCRHCGSDAETGWAEDSDALSVELPEDDPPSEPAGARRSIGWKLGAGLLLAAGAMLAVPCGYPALEFFRYIAYALIGVWFVYVLFGKR